MPGTCVKRGDQLVERRQRFGRKITTEQPCRHLDRLGGRPLGQPRWWIVIRRHHQGRSRIAQDEPADQIGAPQRQMQGHKAAGRVPENHRGVDSQQIAHSGDVISHLLKGARVHIRTAGSALTAQIQEHYLGQLVEAAKTGSEVALIEPRAAVQHNDCRAFDQPALLVESQLKSIDIDIEPRPVHRDQHGALLDLHPPPMTGARQRDAPGMGKVRYHRNFDAE